MGCRCCRLCAHGRRSRAVLERSRAVAIQCEMRNMDSDLPWEPAISEDDPDVPFLGCVCEGAAVWGGAFMCHYLPLGSHLQPFMET